MPKFYCEYCGIYLTHSSPSGRSQHSRGRKHINNRIEYYRQVIQDLQKEQQDFGKPNALLGNMKSVLVQQMPLNVPGQLNALPMQPGMLNPINIPGILPGSINLPINPNNPNQPTLQQGGIRQIQITTQIPQQNQQIIDPSMAQMQMQQMMQPNPMMGALPIPGMGLQQIPKLNVPLLNSNQL